MGQKNALCGEHRDRRVFQENKDVKCKKMETWGQSIYKLFDLTKYDFCIQ